MKITMIYNTVCAFATQRNATQRNATQRNAYHHYILNNNFKFYIYQFFRAVTFLSAVFGFAKIQFAIISHCHYEGVARSNLFSVDCFASFHSLAMTVLSWAMTIKNNFAIFNYAFSYALKNQFEIISRNENYAFNHNKIFCRNGNNRIGKLIRHSPKASYGNEAIYSRSNPIFLDCHADKSARNDKFMVRKDDLFSRNDYGEKFIFGFGDNLNCGFLFNRKTKKINLCQRIALAKENKNEENSSNNSSFAFYGKRKCIRYVWG